VEFVVEVDCHGWRLDTYLAHRVRSLSRAQARALIQSGISSPGRKLKPSSRVQAGLRFTVERPVLDEASLPEAIPIIFEDDALLVLDKPAGLPIHPTGRYHHFTLTSYLRREGGPKADPAHRLDRETSGLVVCGKGLAATAALKASFARGRIQKTYLALVEGWPKGERFTIDLPLQLEGGAIRLRMATGQGKPAVTAVECRARLEGPGGEPFALLALQPHTGRQHQIRAHLAAAGLPIVGDKLYGADPQCFLRFTEGRLTQEDQRRLRLPRQALHAAALILPHPISGASLALASPLPADLRGFVDGLRWVDGRID
jgi:23S rRNA pseudouridine1911/1915/1917 synthase